MLLPVIASVLAIAITSGMDIAGYTNFSALPLAGLLLVFWLIQRLPRKETGFAFGKSSSYLLPLLHPLLVLPALAAAAYFTGHATPDIGAIIPATEEVLLISAVGVLVVLLTEEGFFRGYLWGAFRSAGRGAASTLLLTTAIFTAWHVSFVTLAEGHILPPEQLPLFLGNVALLGLIWGLMRQVSGSVIVPSLAHSVWNGIVYTFFDLTNKSGALGIDAPEIFGPESGWLGFLFNALFALWLWRRAGSVRA